jgi:hypothetical protein
LRLPAALGGDLRAKRGGAKQLAQLGVSLGLKREVVGVEGGDRLDGRARRCGETARAGHGAAATGRSAKQLRQQGGAHGVQRGRPRRGARAERGGGRRGERGGGAGRCAAELRRLRRACAGG